MHVRFYFNVGCVRTAGWDTVLHCGDIKSPHILYVTLAEEQRHTVAYNLSLKAPHLSNSCLHSQSWGCCRESATLVWTGLFLAGMDCERALVLFQSYWLCLKHHNYLVPFEYAESFSSSEHPAHGWTKGGRIYEGSLQLTDTFLVAMDKPGVCSFCNIISVTKWWGNLS